jgi:hypothetical protein
VGSPSSAFVEGIKPKSYGNVMSCRSAKPFSGRTPLVRDRNANLFRLPFGVSIMTWIRFWRSLSNGARRVGSARTPRGLIFMGIGRRSRNNYYSAPGAAAFTSAGGVATGFFESCRRVIFICGKETGRFVSAYSRRAWTPRMSASPIVPSAFRTVDTVKDVLSW